MLNGRNEWDTAFNGQLNPKIMCTCVYIQSLPKVIQSSRKILSFCSGSCFSLLSNTTSVPCISCCHFVGLWLLVESLGAVCIH